MTTKKKAAKLPKAEPKPEPCHHPRSHVRYTPDPSGNNDTLYECQVCGKELKGKDRVAMREAAKREIEADSVAKVADDLEKHTLLAGFVARLRKLADAKPTMPKSVGSLCQWLKNSGDSTTISLLVAVRADFAPANRQ